MRTDLASELAGALSASGAGLAEAALAVARIEYPHLDAARYLARIEIMGHAARDAVAAAVDQTGDSSLECGIKAVNAYLFRDERFVGNRDAYDDPRNSCLNEVLDRRTGIPITLSIVYMEVARRAGLAVDGINFPGHFLVQCPSNERPVRTGLIIDPFHSGALLSELDCRLLLRKYVGAAAAFDPALLVPATRTEIVTRLLTNLKRLYVQMRSFPQAYDVTDLLVTLTPSALSELRDRGLLAYHLNDVSGALRDLQTYLKLARVNQMDEEQREEHDQIWEHVKTLRKRVASLN